MKLPLEAEITGSLPQTDCQMEIYLQRSIIFEVQIGEMKRVELAFRNANLEDMLENIS